MTEKILVTGASGFIGSHLSEALVEKGAQVKALCHYNSHTSYGDLENSLYKDSMEIVLGDIRDSHQMERICKGIDKIYHLAALIAIPFSYHAPSSYVETNVHGTLNLLQAALKNGVTKFIHTSTSEVYGTALSVPISEMHPLQAQSPYSATKIAADALAYSFFTSFNLPIVIARPFNTFGPRQSARAIIPTIITQLLAGQKILKLGALAPTRDFNFVLDTCRGLMALAECDQAIGKTVNIGSGTEISIQNTVALIAELMGVEVSIEIDTGRIRPGKSEVERLVCDNTLIKNLTGHRPIYDLNSGLVRTIEWFGDSDNLKNYKPNIFNV